MHCVHFIHIERTCTIMHYVQKRPTHYSGRLTNKNVKRVIEKHSVIVHWMSNLHYFFKIKTLLFHFGHVHFWFLGLETWKKMTTSKVKITKFSDWNVANHAGVYTTLSKKWTQPIPKWHWQFVIYVKYIPNTPYC